MSLVNLRIARKYLCPLTDTGVENWTLNTQDRAGNPDKNVAGNLIVLQGDLEAIKLYASGTAGWLIDIAETLFGKDANGTVYKFNTSYPTIAQGMVDNDVMFEALGTTLMIPINRNDTLAAGLYEFRPTAIGGVVLSRLFPTQHVKCPDPGSGAGEFSKLVQVRDKQRCVISGISRVNTPLNEASHLTPKRLGHTPIARIVQRAGIQVAWKVPDHAEYDPQVGVLLFYPLDRLVDSFKAGFYTPDPTNHPNDHVVHNFASSDVNDISILGVYHNDLANALTAINNASNLHGAKRTIAAGAGGTGIIISQPPPAIFQWHYLQCVLRKFPARKPADPTKLDNSLGNFPNIYW